MPRKLRELEADLARAGFIKKPAKGSHRKWIHPKAKVSIARGILVTMHNLIKKKMFARQYARHSNDKEERL